MSEGRILRLNRKARPKGLIPRGGSVLNGGKELMPGGLPPAEADSLNGKTGGVKGGFFFVKILVTLSEGSHKGGS